MLHSVIRNEAKASHQLLLFQALSYSRYVSAGSEPLIEIQQYCRMFSLQYSSKFLYTYTFICENQKIENPSTTHKFYVDLGQKRYLGPRDLIIGYRLGGGAGLN